MNFRRASCAVVLVACSLAPSAANAQKDRFVDALIVFRTALGGTFYAQYVLFIDPESVFPTSLSILICLVAVLGGVGTTWGPALGALVLIALSETTRVWLGGTGKAIDLMIYGGLIVLVSVFQPGGLMALLGRLAGRPGGAAPSAPVAVPQGTG